MSEEVEFLKHVYQSFNARDMDSALAAMHEDVIWANGMEGGYVYGRDGVRTYWTRQWAIIDPHVDLNSLRARIGMVFQKPTPFPMTIYDNVAFGVKLHEKLSKSGMDERVEWSLTRGAIWDEVKDRLHTSAMGLSGGQQQRLCIARTIAVRPEVILFDEPTSALDPISTLKIEELIDELKHDFTIAIVTHNMQQAARCADQVAFFYLGEMVEVAPAGQMFTAPRERRTQEYITCRFG